MNENMRGLKLGLLLFDDALKCAKDAGAEFYMVQMVISYAKEMMIARHEFECAKEIVYADYFADQAGLPCGRFILITFVNHSCGKPFNPQGNPDN